MLFFFKVELGKSISPYPHWITQDTAKMQMAKILCAFGREN